MSRSRHKLSDVAVKAARKPGRHADGGGLYLNVSSSGSKSWVFMWVREAKRTEMGLGSYPSVSLASARQKSEGYRGAVAAGRNPKAERDKEAEPSFGECADRFIESIEAEWRNAKHRYQWSQTLTDYCHPIRQKRVSEIGTDDVLKVLTPIWQTKSETAARLRGRIERVLDFAKVKGWRAGENPAAWRGHLRNILPKRKKLQKGHQPAMAYGDVPAFVLALKDTDMTPARALEFTILTASRSGEVLGAKWQEVDFDQKLWKVPKERMKAGVAHTVPLSDRAVALLRDMYETRLGDFVFPGARPKKPLSNMAMMMMLRRMKQTEITVHGFRSSFRDWAGDVTTFPRELAEAALAHKVGDEVERAYRRSDALEKRRKLMQAWADYLTATDTAKIIPIRKK